MEADKVRQDAGKETEVGSGTRADSGESVAVAEKEAIGGEAEKEREKEKLDEEAGPEKRREREGEDDRSRKRWKQQRSKEKEKRADVVTGRPTRSIEGECMLRWMRREGETKMRKHRPIERG